MQQLQQLLINLNQKLQYVNLKSIPRYNQIRSRMKTYQNRSISQILALAKGNKAGVLPKTTVLHIEKAFELRVPIYHYQVMNLYNHLSIYKDQYAFNRIDRLFFPRGSLEVIQPTFQLAYRRLYCLIKYNLPHRLWLIKVRELLHESRISAVDMKFIFSLGNLEIFNNDEQFRQFYDEFLSIFIQDYKKLDSLTLIALRRIYQKNKIKSIHITELKSIFSGEIQMELKYMTSSQLKFMFQTRKNNFHELFQFFFKFHTIDKKYAFYLLYLCNVNSDWVNWAKKNIPRQMVLDIIPARKCDLKPINIIQGLISHCIFRRPYFDDFFQFIEIDVNGKKQTRLKNPELYYIPFIINAYYYFYPSAIDADYKQFEKIKQVISQTKYLLKNPNFLFLYLTVRHSIIFHSQIGPQERLKQQMEMIKEIAVILKNVDVQLDPLLLKNSMLLPTTSFRNIAVMEFDVYLIPEFEVVLKKVVSLSIDLEDTPMNARISKEFNQVIKVMNSYMEGKRPAQNEIIYQQFEKVKMDEDSQYEISIAKNAEVNKCVLVQYLVKVKNKLTGKEIKYLLDFTLSSSTTFEKNLFKIKHWKYYYLVEWCKHQYEIVSITSLEEYFRGQTFKNFIKILD